MAGLAERAVGWSSDGGEARTVDDASGARVGAEEVVGGAGGIDQGGKGGSIGTGEGGTQGADGGGQGAANELLVGAQTEARRERSTMRVVPG
jgi:hypothetical protein